MPTLRITIEKFCAPLNGEYWTNIYHVNAADVAAAVPLMDAIVAAEASVLYASCIITKGRVDDMVENTDVYFTKVYNTPGGVSTTNAGEFMPLFNVVRVDFGSTAGGRPSRKYYRGCLGETDTGGVTLTSGLLSRFATFVVTMIGTGYCDSSGADINSGATWPQPAMRQLRRGSKKKVTQLSGTPA
jgi:hypothetical protein